MNDLITCLKQRFSLITEQINYLEKKIDSNKPEKRIILEKLTEGLLWLRLLIDQEEAEINNPINIRLKEKAHADESIPGN